ncbi:MAG TPA: MFS transporter, partial [Rhodospirillales bacterium]|nr:MFS transporter [Rhodospirillales bacterium]
KEGLAALTSAAGIGALIFASVLAFRGKTKGLTTFLVIGQSGSALFLIAFALTENFFVGLATLALVGGLLVFAATSAQSLIQHSVDDDYRARVISINVSLVLGAPAISALIIGWLAEFIGLQWAIVWPAIVSLAIFLPVGLLLRRRRRKIEAEKV